MVFWWVMDMVFGCFRFSYYSSSFSPGFRESNVEPRITTKKFGTLVFEYHVCIPQEESDSSTS